MSWKRGGQLRQAASEQVRQKGKRAAQETQEELLRTVPEGHPQVPAVTTRLFWQPKQASSLQIEHPGRVEQERQLPLMMKFVRGGQTQLLPLMAKLFEQLRQWVWSQVRQFPPYTAVQVVQELPERTYPESHTQEPLERVKVLLQTLH